MRFRVRLFGRTCLAVTFDAGPALELDEEGITGGPSLLTERDTDPLIPEHRHNHEYEERGFGFKC